MNKGFWKGLAYGFTGTLPLYLMLNGVFWALQTFGVIQPGKNPILIIITYAIVILVYLIGMIVYFRNQSSKNLEKLKRDVEKISGKKLT